jgi:hypothetical protein
MSRYTNAVILKIILSLLLLVSLSASAASSAASYNSRAERWEFFLAPMYTNSKVLQFENGAEADINSRSSLGFGFGYNINRNIELAVIFASSSGNYSGTRIIDNDPEDPDIPNGPQKVSSNMYTSSLDFGFTYNFIYRFRRAYRQYLDSLLVGSLVGLYLQPQRSDLYNNRIPLRCRCRPAL